MKNKIIYIVLVLSFYCLSFCYSEEKEDFRNYVEHFGLANIHLANLVKQRSFDTKSIELTIKTFATCYLESQKYGINSRITEKLDKDILDTINVKLFNSNSNDLISFLKIRGFIYESIPEYLVSNLDEKILSEQAMKVSTEIKKYIIENENTNLSNNKSIVTQQKTSEQINSNKQNQNIEIIDFDDFLLDKEILIGKTIKIKGYYRHPGRYLLFRNQKTINNQIVLDIDGLSRDVRKWLLQNCEGGHWLTITAKVEKRKLKVLQIEDYEKQIKY